MWFYLSDYIVWLSWTGRQPLMLSPEHTGFLALNSDNKCMMDLSVLLIMPEDYSSFVQTATPLIINGVHSLSKTIS